MFKLDTAGKQTVLLNNGSPSFGVLLDSSGNLYGTTSGGGEGYGTVFEIAPSGKVTTLHNFTGGDGSYPQMALIRDKAGNLYGTTYLGGGGGCFGGEGCGVVFKLDTTGTLTVLHSFDGGAKDGANPVAGLIRDAAGDLYGTTLNSGTYNLGTVFRILPTL